MTRTNSGDNTLWTSSITLYIFIYDQPKDFKAHQNTLLWLKQKKDVSLVS
jgi:hypothetical protein